MFASAPKHVLYLSAKGLLLVGFSGKKPDSLQAFISENEVATSSNGRAPSIDEFEQWLVAHNKDTFDILIDSVDEQQHIEIMPRLQWGDRQALIKRKLVQHFRDSEFTTYHLKNVRVDGRASVSALLMALRNDGQFTQWIELLLKHQVRIDSMASPALLTEQLVQAFRPRGSGLLVSLNPAGLRQTVIMNGRVQFSRLATLKNDDAVEIQAEITRTLQYLLMSQRISRDQIRGGKFEVWMIDTGFDQQIGLASEIFIDEGATVEVGIVDPTTLGIPVLAGQVGLSMWLQAPGKSKIKDYRNKRLSRFARLARARKILWSTSSVVASVGLAALLSVGWLIETTLPETSQQRQEYEILEEQGLQLEFVLSEFSVSSEEMGAIAGNADAIRARSVRPWEVLRAVGDAMTQDTGMRINQLSWEPESGGGNAAGTGAPPPPDSFDDDATQANGPVGVTRIRVAGSVDPTWTKQESNEKVRQLAQRLAQQCNCLDPKIQYPYDPSPGVGISQDYAGDNVKRPPFSFYVQAPLDSPIHSFRTTSRN